MRIRPPASDAESDLQADIPCDGRLKANGGLQLNPELVVIERSLRSRAIPNIENDLVPMRTYKVEFRLMLTSRALSSTACDGITCRFIPRSAIIPEPLSRAACRARGATHHWHPDFGARIPHSRVFPELFQARRAAASLARGGSPWIRNPTRFQSPTRAPVTLDAHDQSQM